LFWFYNHQDHSAKNTKAQNPAAAATMTTTGTLDHLSTAAPTNSAESQTMAIEQRIFANITLPFGEGT
jgi:hypothetical protein